MEDLFELAIILLVFIFGAVAKSNKKKKKAADKPAPAKMISPDSEALESSIEPPKPAQPAKPVTEAKKALSKQNLENAIAAFSELLDIEDEEAAKPKKKAKKKKPASGESPVDAHGCIGGSMPIHSAEGESLAEHAAHEQNRQLRLQQETAIHATDLRKPTAADLRKAVVMSEILDKPVALRRRQI